MYIILFLISSTVLVNFLVKYPAFVFVICLAEKIFMMTTQLIIKLFIYSHNGAP